MLDEIQDLLNRYFTRVKDKTTLRQVGNWVEITTPFLDRHNDYLQIYIKQDDGGFTLSDGGYILTDLRQSGCDLEKRIGDLMDGFGVELEDGSLIIHTTASNFAPQMYNLVQAMLAVNYLIYK